MTMYDTRTKTKKSELTNEGLELLHVGHTWYVMKDGKTLSGFSTKKVAIRAMLGYAEWR